MSKTPAEVAAALEASLEPLGFTPPKKPVTIEHPRLLRAWVRKTWNTNRGVVLLEAPPGEDVVVLGQAAKSALAKQLGYIFFVYGIGLQLVWVGTQLRGEGSAPEDAKGVSTPSDPTNPYQPPAAPLQRRAPGFGDLSKGVDRFDNQWGIIQSVFCFDLETGERWQGRTWGQVVTGRFQDAIWETLKRLNAS
ncbi:MAG: hypothetical protein JKY65_08750 [Planctomycetes bacterium]|nr:hypothetical protein [Planctomycetota bacterium]